MGKLGKKARKFSKKNLQSVERRNRKIKSTFKKRAPKTTRNEISEQELKKQEALKLTNASKTEVEYTDNTPLDAIFREDDSGAFEDESGSDGYLSEDCSEMQLADSKIEASEEGIPDGNSVELSIQNQEIKKELVKNTKKLYKLKEKDPEFANFLVSHQKEREQFGNKDSADEDEDGMSDDNMEPENVQYEFEYRQVAY